MTCQAYNNCTSHFEKAWGWQTCSSRQWWALALAIVALASDVWSSYCTDLPPVEILVMVNDNDSYLVFAQNNVDTVVTTVQSEEYWTSILNVSVAHTYKKQVLSLIRVMLWQHYKQHDMISLFWYRNSNTRIAWKKSKQKSLDSTWQNVKELTFWMLWLNVIVM